MKHNLIEFTQPKRVLIHIDWEEGSLSVTVDGQTAMIANDMAQVQIDQVGQPPEQIMIWRDV